MSKIGKFASILGVIGFILVTVTIYNSNWLLNRDKYNDNERIKELEEIIKEQNLEIDDFKKFIDENSKIPQPGILDVKGVPRDVANRYYLVYVQLILLAETAKAPDSNLRRLRRLVRKGVLHNVLERYSLIGIDTTYNPPKLAAQFSTEINWKDCSLYTKLKSNLNTDQSVYDQKTMYLAGAFSELVERENLKVEMRCRTVKKPNFDALNTLGVPDYEIGLDTIIKIKEGDFKKLIDEKLDLTRAESLEWRDGDEEIITVNSSITPELTVKLKYMRSKKKNIKD